MTIVNDILKQMPGLGQPQRKFLATLFVTILVLRGRVNFRNLSRSCDYSELYRSTVFWTPSDLKLCGIRQGTSLLMSHLGRGFVAMPSNQPSLIVLTLELVQR